MSNQLLAAALSAVTKQVIISHEEYLREKNHRSHSYMELNGNYLHQYNLIGGKVSTVGIDNEEMQIYVKTLNSETLSLFVNPNNSLEEIKTKIEEEGGIPSVQQRLMFEGLQMEEEKTLSEQNVRRHSTLHLFTQNAPIYYLQSSHVSPEYNYDFTNIQDNGHIFMRGAFPYKRPCGWYRFALNVLNKYESNDWLGASQIRKTYADAVDNEWPVSYHGTDKHNLKSIADDGYLQSKGRRSTFGYGIYSTPDIDLAALYATRFVYEGDFYKVVLQNRINPRTLNIVPNNGNGTGDFWISPKEKDLRPYGICVKKDVSVVKTDGR